MDSSTQATSDSGRIDARLGYLVYGLSAVLMVAEVTYEKHPHFPLEGWFGFYGACGFGAMMLVFGGALLTRPLLRREDAQDDELAE